MRVRSKVILGVTAALVIAATGTVFWYVRSGRLQEFARVDLISRVQKATGMVCTVGRLELAPLRGEFRLTGITLGPITDGAGPLTASIDEVKGRVSLSSIWHLSLHLAELNVLRPRVTLTSTQGGGGWDPENVLKSLRTSLDLAAGSILLTDGWVQLDNTHIPLNLSLNDVICEIHYVADHPHYCIRLAYKNSRLLYEGRDIKYNLDTRINLSMEGVEVGSFRLEHGKSLLSGNGWVRGWKAPVLLLHAAGILDGTDLALFSSDLREARGSFHVATNLRVDSGGLRLDGKFDLQSGGFRRASLSSLRGLFEIRKDVLYLNAVDGKLGAGAIHADGEIQLREGNKPPNRVLISTRDVCLREVSYVLNLSEIDFLNTADSTAEVIWKHGNEDLDLTVQAGLKAPPSSSLEPGRSTPLQGDLAFSYRRGVWYFTSANLNSAQTAVAIAGQGGTTFHIQAHTSRVAEPLSVLRGFVPSLERLLSRQPDLIEVSGTYGLNGNMLMEPERTVYQGALTIKDGQWHTHRVDSLASKALWEGSHLELHEMNLHKGAESAAGDLTLEIPSEEGESLGMTFQGKAGNVSLPSLRELGVEMSPDIGGTLSGSGRISNADGTWAGDAQFLLENGSYKGEPFDSIHGKFKTRNKILQIADCQIARGAAKVAAHGQIQLDTNQMELTLGLAGLSLEEIPEIQDKNPEVEGRISGAGELRGDIDNPRFKGNLDLTGLRYASWDLGSGKGTLDLEDRILRANVNVQSSLGKLGAQARISMEQGLPGKATLEFRDLNFQEILSGNIPAIPSDLSTALQGRVDAEGRFSEPSSLSANGEVDGGRIKINDYELRNAGKMLFTASNGNLRIEKVNMVGEGSSLFINGLIPLDNSPRLDLSLSGNLNLILLQHLEKSTRVSGTAVLNVRATGAPRDPQIIGQAAVQNGRLEYGDLPVHLSAMQGNIIFSRKLVRFENISGSAGSGSLKVSGVFEHDNGELRGINIQASAQKVRLPYPKDFRSLVDAELSLRGSQETQVLSGEIAVVRADYLRDINLLEQLVVRSNSSPGPLTTDPFLQGIRLDVDIRSDRGLHIENELTSLRGSILLTLKGTPAYPYLTGRVEASEGSIFFRGNRFDIIHASADFVDRNRINPVLDIRAEADVKTYRLVMDVNGDLDHMNINVTSDPPLSTVDIVSLLTTGKSLDPTTENTRRQSEMAGISAASILSESLTGVIGKRVQRIFGLQTFRVDPFLAGAENDPTARVTISERISKDLTVTFSRNLSTNEEQIVVLEYDVTRNLTIVASRDEQGKFGLDFRFRKRFH